MANDLLAELYALAADLPGGPAPSYDVIVTTQSIADQLPVEPSDRIPTATFMGIALHIKPTKAEAIACARGMKATGMRVMLCIEERRDAEAAEAGTEK